MPELKLTDWLRHVGLSKGDIVLVHSEVAPTNLGQTLAAFKEVLGDSGTLIVPTFTYGFCSGKPYDDERTPSEVGLFTEYVRRLPESVRSLHPIYSFAGIGPQAHALLDNVSHSSFGRGSVFERLLEADAKILFLNCSFERCTFVHYTEQLMNVPYRFLMYFTGQITASGQTYTDTYDMFCRYLDRDIESSFVRLFAAIGKNRGKGENVTCVRAREIHEAVMAGLRRDPWFLLAREPEAGGATFYGFLPVAPALNSPYLDSRPIEIVKRLYPLHRTLVSDEMDNALSWLTWYLPDSLHYKHEMYRPTAPVWTWRVPERYVVHEAYIDVAVPQNQTGGISGGTYRIADFNKNALHLVSYSPSIDKWMDWEELAPHLHYSEGRPDAIPWMYRFYERDWGFCLSKKQYDELVRRLSERQYVGDGRYHAVIRSEYLTAPEDGLRVGVASLPGTLDGEILLLAHICHPMQANDDASGVAVLVDVARRLAANPLTEPHYGVRFLFVPETIGSVCYLSQHPEIAAKLKAGVFVEMAGTEGAIRLQWSYQEEADITNIALHQLPDEYTDDDFRKVICNDEMVVNGPGVNVPCVSLSRWPYPEYHTSDDTPDIIKPEKLDEMADVVERIVRIAGTNYTPKRCFDGPLFLSGYRLFDFGKLSVYQKEMVMMNLEGDRTLWQIAEAANADYWEVRKFAEEMRTRGLVGVVD